MTTTPKTGRTTPKKSKVTSAEDWKKSSGVVEHELEVPSGKVCLVKRPGIQTFVRSGMIPNGLMEHIMPLLEQSQEPGVKDPVKAEELAAAELEKLKSDMLNNPEKIDQMIAFVDRITVECVIQPKVHAVPTFMEDGKEVPVPLSNRDPDNLYVDEVDLNDKTFIMNFCVGGSDDLASFREGTTAALAD